MPDFDDDALSGVDDALDALDEQEAEEAPVADPNAAPDDDEDEEGEAEAKTDSDEEDDEDKAEDEDAKPKSMGSRVDRRIGKLTREKNDARREADYWKQQAESTASQVSEWLKSQQGQPDANGRPQALSPDAIRQEATRIASETIAAQQFQSRVTTLRQEIEKAGAGDALARLANERLTRFEAEAVEALSDAKFKVEIVKALGRNDDLFEQFSKLPSGVQRANFIARLDGRIEARREAKQPGNTVKPTRNVRGSARPVEKNPEDMSQAEYEKYREKQGWS